jgi:enediyne polyketide synthase
VINQIAIVGIACRYPDASSPDELWENVLAGRRAFRRIPDERMRLEDYWSPDPAAPDKFYARNAAVIEGFEFDRVKYKIAGSTYRTTDMTHWLALDTAARALADAGFADGDGLPRASTSVIIGNSLTGEFARANLMRLRWPFVRRTLGSALKEMGWDDAGLAGLLATVESRYKSAFPPVDEDTLAGGLSNTIAGRICNQFDFGGGGYTVDGACSSSLLSVLTACTALSEGTADAAVAGGVDLSIDPFETIGFAKTGALATGDMRVYDRHSNGFWPGEGCGMVVLMRLADAEAQGRRVYATIAGWGYSSDGRGGITRPEVSGHRRAIDRAYRQAGFDIGTVGYLEGHGTGTAVGDATELRAFTEARRAVRPDAEPALISTVKGNIGHTKAAAGVAGLIKAAMAVHHQVIPPATGHAVPHQVLAEDQPALRVPLTAELWPAGLPVRAGVSSMGFGGINAHVVLAGDDSIRRTSLDARTIRLTESRQDAEVLLLDAGGQAELRDRAASLAELCERLAFAELGDLAATLARDAGQGAVRAAVVAASPEQAAERLRRLLAAFDDGAERLVDPAGGVFLGRAPAQGTAPAAIGFLFPGQGSGRNTAGALSRRFTVAREAPRSAAALQGRDEVATDVAQPRIVSLSLEGLRVLGLLGIEATMAAGHSLGELTALHWAGAMAEGAVVDLAAERGRVMAAASAGGGAMSGIAASPEVVEGLLSGALPGTGAGTENGADVVIAGYNGPRQTVISGPAAAVDRVRRAAEAKDLVTIPIRVSHAFHSPAVEPAAAGLDQYLAGREFSPLARRVLSTVTGDALPADADLRQLLVRQVRQPVLFTQAVAALGADADLLIEVGPGHVLSALAADIVPGVPVIALETDGPSLSGLLSAVAACYVLGVQVKAGELFAGRFTRPLAVDKEFRFFASPCESAPEDVTAGEGESAGGQSLPQPFGEVLAGSTRSDSLEILRRLAAERAELPLETVLPGSHPLDELHLSSITVGQIMNQAARALGVTAPMVTSNFATSTLADLAEALDGLAATALPGDGESRLEPEGVGPWVRAFSVELAESGRLPLPAVGQAEDSPAGTAGEWQVFASAGHPLSEPLGQALRDARTGDGVLLCLPADCGPEHVGLMLSAAKAALARERGCRFVAVGGRRGAAGLAKTLHLEAPALPVTVVTVPSLAGLSGRRLLELSAEIAADAAATAGFSEVHYDESGIRRVPLLRPVVDLPGGQPPPLGAADVLLVSGGGKGITAECALSLAVRTGAAVALLGRSDPDADPELAANLGRFAAAGVRYRYVRGDVTSSAEVAAAVAQFRDELGTVTAVLHGAGRNVPSALTLLDEESFLRTLAPKLDGLAAILDAVDPAELKLLVTFASIIGRAGLRGQADYATANDWLTDETTRFAAAHPHCRCAALEWSVWAGAGMGERLGVLESLTREGITPIAVDDGTEILHAILGSPRLPPSLVVMGRAGGLPTISFEQRELPLARFVDSPRVHYPGVEIVADTELSADSDPYLADHLLDGDLLFPAVLGMEAMAQAGAALTSAPGAPAFENVEFLRPIVVPPDGTTMIRVAALRQGDAIEVAIRSADTGFLADHFRATLRYGDKPADHAERVRLTPGGPRVPLDPAADLYGGIFFQGKRFQRVLGYLSLSSVACVAEISAVQAGSWFAGYLPAQLQLSDPGTRDAFMHAIQCCVPDATLLPAGVERLYAAPAQVRGEQLTLHAAERARDGDTYTYDLDIRDSEGMLVERWAGLRLQAVRKTGGAGPWVPALLGPYLERQAAPFLHEAPRCAVEPDQVEPALDGATRRGRTDAAVSAMLSRPVTVLHRGDGKPELPGEDIAISASHGAGVTLAVGRAGRVGCDVEVVRQRATEDWQGLLGAGPFALAELIQREQGEEFPVAATRVWSAVECLRKSGRVLPGPVTLAGAAADGWVLLESGRSKIATFRTRLQGQADAVIFAILTEGDSHESVLRVPAHRWFRGNQPGRQRLLRQLHPVAGQVQGNVPARARARRARRPFPGPQAVHHQVRVRVPGRDHGVRRAVHQDAPGGAHPDPDRIRLRLRAGPRRVRGACRPRQAAGGLHARLQRCDRADPGAGAPAAGAPGVRDPGCAAAEGGRHRGQGMSLTVFSQPPPDTGHLRSVLGRFATGVTIVAAGTETPCGMTANAFTSVSVEPPLILVCVTRSSELYSAVRREGRFAVSVLAAQQEHLARYFADHDRPRGAAEFAGVRWGPGPGTGAPVIDGALAWLDCAVAASYRGGDHEIFLGSVLAAGTGPDGAALIFFRGGFCRSPLDAGAPAKRGPRVMSSSPLEIE